MKENNSKWNNWQRTNFRNTQAPHSTQYQKNKQCKQKVSRRSKLTFLQRRHTGGYKHVKRCSTWLIIREMQIKTTMRYQLTPVRIAIIKKSTNNEWPEGVEKNEELYWTTHSLIKRNFGQPNSCWMTTTFLNSCKNIGK